MTTLLNLIHSLLLSGDGEREYAEAYLANSSDIYDLERRMHALAHASLGAW